jgi:hypothetical protein
MGRKTTNLDGNWLSNKSLNNTKTLVDALLLQPEKLQAFLSNTSAEDVLNYAKTRIESQYQNNPHKKEALLNAITTNPVYAQEQN